MGVETMFFQTQEAKPGGVSTRVQHATSHIVVIDDRVTNRNILARLAQSVEEGLQVHTFARARDALSSMRSGLAPDLIITDYNMPEMDGATFITLVRSESDIADVPIIVVTVYEDRDFCYRALEAGATDFLLSPVDHVEFRARARNLLTLRRQQKLLAERAERLANALREQQSPFEGPQSAFAAALDVLPAAVSITDPQGRLLYVNEAYADLFDTIPEALIGRLIADTHDEAFATRQAVLNEKVLQTGRPLARPQPEPLAAGKASRTLLSVKAPLVDQAAPMPRVVTLALDVTDFAESGKAGSERIHDRVTGLPGPELVRERLAEELARARRHGHMVALLLLDLDRFKGINDAFGSEFGDALLHEVGARLGNLLRETDHLGRWEGDSFIILQTGVRRADEAAELCHRLSEAFAQPFLISEEEVHVSASVGITLFPSDGTTTKSLLRNADLAMYRAKKAGRDTYRFFSSEMNAAARRAVALERELRQALAAEQFLLYYQPQLDLRTGRMVGAEALIRWNHPRRGIVRPGEFIDLVEEIGLMAPLTAWVLRTACTQFRAWLDAGFEGTQLSVNFSPLQFRERGVELLIERVLRETGLDPHHLDVELTENAVLDNSRITQTCLRHLRRLGVRLSIDDFGTGYSSLAYLRRLPAHRLKIDRSFIRDLASEGSDEVIIRAIIGLGHSLGLRVIAEGVETEKQLARLRELGCDEAQGDHLSPPLSTAAFEARILRRSASGPDPSGESRAR